MSSLIIGGVDYGDSVDSSGMVSTDPSPEPASNVDMPDPDSTPSQPSAPGGFMSSIESFGSTVVSKAEGAVKTVYGGVKTVATDVTQGTENAVSSVTGNVTSNLVIILVVVGVALVLIAKSGAVKISA